MPGSQTARARIAGFPTQAGFARAPPLHAMMREMLKNICAPLCFQWVRGKLFASN